MDSNYVEAWWEYKNNNHRYLELGVSVEIISSNNFSFLDEDTEESRAHHEARILTEPDS